MCIYICIAHTPRERCVCNRELYRLEEQTRFQCVHLLPEPKSNSYSNDFP